MKSTKRILAASATAIVLTSLGAGVAEATPSRGVTAEILWQKTVAGKDYIFREITIQPGGSTGWHFHDGNLHGVVKQGTLTHNKSDCSIDGIYRTGQTIQESGGADYVHVGRNLGSTPIILDVLYVDPAGAPLSEDAPNPGCAFD